VVVVVDVVLVDVDVLVDVLVLVDVDVLVLVLVLVELVVVVDVGMYSQHSDIAISCHFPTVGFFLLKIKEPATTLLLPS
jgi:hypothetical protein